MHICFVYLAYPPDLHGYGIGTFLDNYVNVLKQNDQVKKISIIVLSEKKSVSKKIILQNCKIDLYRLKRHGGIGFLKIISHFINIFKIFLLALKINQTQKIDVFELCDLGAYGLLLNLHPRTREKTIVRVHGPSFILDTYSLHKKIFGNYVYSLEKMQLKHSKLILYPTIAVKNQIEKIIGVFKNEIAEAHILDGSVICKKKNYNQKFKNLRILSVVGRVEQGKGLEPLIKSILSLRAANLKVKLFVVGSDSPDNSHGTYRHYLQSLVSEDKNAVEFLGFLERKKLLKMYCNFDIFVSASSFETIGYALFEAFAAGLPIIASNTGIAQLLSLREPDLMLTFDQQDKGSISNKIVKLVKLFYKDEGLRKKLGLKCQQIFDEKYSSRQLVERNVDLYKSFIKEYRS